MNFILRLSTFRESFNFTTFLLNKIDDRKLIEIEIEIEVFRQILIVKNVTFLLNKKNRVFYLATLRLRNSNLH